MLDLQYSSTNNITKVMFYGLLQDYESQSVSVSSPGLSFLPALLMVSEAFSLAPCVYPLLVYYRSSLNFESCFHLYNMLHRKTDSIARGRHAELELDWQETMSAVKREFRIAACGT